MQSGSRRMVAQWQHTSRLAGCRTFGPKISRTLGFKGEGVLSCGEVTHVHDTNSLPKSLLRIPDFLTAIQIAGIRS